MLFTVPYKAIPHWKWKRINFPKKYFGSSAKRACGASWVSKSTHPRKFGNDVTVHMAGLFTGFLVEKCVACQSR